MRAVGSRRHVSRQIGTFGPSPYTIRARWPSLITLLVSAGVVADPWLLLRLTLTRRRLHVTQPWWDFSWLRREGILAPTVDAATIDGPGGRDREATVATCGCGVENFVSYTRKVLVVQIRNSSTKSGREFEFAKFTSVPDYL